MIMRLIVASRPDSESYSDFDMMMVIQYDNDMMTVRHGDDMMMLSSCSQSPLSALAALRKELIRMQEQDNHIPELLLYISPLIHLSFIFSL